MKLWGSLVALLYVLLLAALAGPLAGVLFLPVHSGGPAWPDFIRNAGAVYAGYNQAGAWLVLAVALLAQAALLSVPVEVRAGRRVTKRTVVPLVVATSFAVTLLLAGALLAADELFRMGYSSRHGGTALAVFLAVWLMWALVFFRQSREMEPAGFLERSCRWIFKGSVLELLVAVPSHIIVRQRYDCCAGVQTGMGIALGIAVMLLAFGPGVFFLYAGRFEQKLSRGKTEQS